MRPSRSANGTEGRTALQTEPDRSESAGSDTDVDCGDGADSPAKLNIGSRIYHARLLRELRMKDIAVAAGCSESLISKIESNKVVPSLRVLHRICEALNLAIGDLLGGAADQHSVVTRAQDRHIVEIDSLRRGDGIRRLWSG